MHASHRYVERKARIGFVIYYPFQFYVYKNVYQELRGDAEFIIDCCFPFPEEQQNQLIHDIVELLRKHKARYRLLRPEDYRHAAYLRRFFESYECLVSVWERGCMNVPATIGIRKVNMIYGAGKDLTLVRPTRGLYDLTLAYSERDARLLSYFSETTIVGNPKFDDWFKNDFDEQLLADLRKRIDPQKKTIVYLPTHGDLSSVDQLSEELKKLAPTFNVIVKTHYYLTREEPKRLQKLNDPRLLLYADDTDLLPLLKLADVVVSDNSSAIFDAVLADKPLLVADFWDREFLDYTHKETRVLWRGTQGALTYSESIEQIIKHDGSVVAMRSPNEIPVKIQDALSDSESRKKRRDELRRELFAFNDGKCAMRAAEAIRALLAQEKTTSKPILYHAFEAYKARIGLLPFFRERKLQSRIQELERSLTVSTDLPSVSICVLRTANDTNLEKQTLRSLFEQRYADARFSITILSAGDRRDAILLPSSDRNVTVRYEHENTSNWGAVIARFIRTAKSDYIFFTTTECTTHPDTLFRFSRTLADNPLFAGVGGYTLPAPPGVGNVFTRYALHRIRQYQDLADMPWETPFYTIAHGLLARHPTGDIRNVMYVRTGLSGVYLGNDLYCVQATLRGFAARKGILAFSPMAANSNSTTFRELIRASYFYGYFELYFASQYVHAHSIRYGLRILATFFHDLRYGGIRAFIYMPVEVVRWIGAIRARLHRIGLLERGL